MARTGIPYFQLQVVLSEWPVVQKSIDEGNMNLLNQVIRSKKGKFVYIHIGFTEFAD